MEKKKCIYQTLLLILLIIMGSSSILLADNNIVDDDIISNYVREMRYEDYLNKYQGASRPDEEIIISATNYINASNGVKVSKNFIGYNGPVAEIGERDFIEWEINIEKAGLYNIELSYYPLEGRGSEIERDLQINGERPFAGAKYLTFKRVWGDKGEIRKDSLGNEILPQQVQKPMWMDRVLQDSLGYVDEPYLFYFKAGKNTLRLISRSESMAIGKVRLFQKEELPEYYQVLEENKDKKKVEDFILKLQGREALYRSDSSLFPIHDKGDPTVEPYHPAQIRLNSIGGHRWSQVGQWVNWEFEVPEDGLYKIALKAKQEISRGSYSNRRIYIDDKIPFEELKAVPFPFSSDYKMTVLGNEEEPYYFYLNEGKHQLKLEVVLGDLSNVLMRIEDSLYELNTIYRRIIMITSSTPDPMRSYQIEKRIPEIIEAIKFQQSELEDISNQLQAYTRQKGGHLVTLDNFARLLASMVKDPEVIPSVLGEYRDSIGALGTWIMETRNQPLQIDYVIVASPESDLPKAEASLLQTIKHEANAFNASFSHEYNKIGSLNEEAEEELENNSDVLRVWIGTGRDQAQILKRMLEDKFTPETGIPVQLELIPHMPKLLVRASTTGTGPDVALGVLPQDPMNFAMRGAVVDLKRFDDFEEVAKRFKDSAFLSYSFRDGVYALPERQSFPMMFYRTDILAELGLKIPQTWQDVYDMLPELQKNNMQFGLGSGIGGRGVGTFLTFLYQKNGHFYKPDGIETNLDSEKAIETFNELTDLFTLYDIPLTFNRENRFRMGEMPLVIADYSMYNQLKIFAPELRGEWGFTLIPGTIQEDGSINRTVAASGREASIRLAMLQGTSQGGGSAGPADVLLKQAGDKIDDGWEFLKWWTSMEIQLQFGRELESLLGPAARYPTANIEALKKLPWSLEEREKLLEQWQYVEGYREVPGSYYATRLFDWAFRAVVLDFEPVRETLIDYDIQINEEIATKRREFGLTNDMSELEDEWVENFWDHFSHIKPAEE